MHTPSSLPNVETQISQKQLRNIFSHVVRTLDSEYLLRLFLCKYIPVLTYVCVQHVLREVMLRCTFPASKENCMAFKEICMFCGLSKKDCQIYYVFQVHSLKKQHILQKKTWFYLFWVLFSARIHWKHVLKVIDWWYFRIYPFVQVWVEQRKV